jgi:hypothetical protein
VRRGEAARALFVGLAVALLVSVAGGAPADAQQATAQVVPGMKAVGDLWCAPEGVCLGVGLTEQNVGAVVVLRAAGPPGPIRPVPGVENLSSITCRPGGSCIAVGASGPESVAGRRGVVVEVSPGRHAGPGPAGPRLRPVVGRGLSHGNDLCGNGQPVGRHPLVPLPLDDACLHHHRERPAGAGPGAPPSDRVGLRHRLSERDHVPRRPPRWVRGAEKVERHVERDAPERLAQRRRRPPNG